MRIEEKTWLAVNGSIECLSPDWRQSILPSLVDNSQTEYTPWLDRQPDPYQLTQDSGPGAFCHCELIEHGLVAIFMFHISNTGLFE